MTEYELDAKGERLSTRYAPGMSDRATLDARSRHGSEE